MTQRKHHSRKPTTKPRPKTKKRSINDIVDHAARQVSPRSAELAFVPNNAASKKCHDCGKPSNHPCCNECLDALTNP